MNISAGSFIRFCMAAACAAMLFAVPGYGDEQKAGAGALGGDIGALARSGGVNAAPSMIQEGFSTMAPPFFGQGQQSSAPQQPQNQGGWGQPQQPQQNPGGWAQPQNPAAGQSIVGMWSGQANGQIFVMAFMPNGSYCLGINNQQFYGSYTVQGSHVHIQMQNGQTVDVDFAIQGDILRLSDGTVLQRQQMPAVQQPQQQQNPGAWGQPQQPQQPQSYMATPLEGTWSAQTPNGTFLFMFHGSQYRAFINGALVEAGVFQLNGNRLRFQVTQGQNAGQQGENVWQIQGNVLVMITQNGGSIQFIRQ